jgi:hypothetical protein
MANYLKNVKDITAPLNWQSAPDSPPTELAYITEEEKDLLLKADLHGSLGDGQPNVGPKGIMSLDGDDVDRKIKGVKQKKAAKRTVKATKATKQARQRFAERSAAAGGKSAYEQNASKQEKQRFDDIRKGKIKVSDSEKYVDPKLFEKDEEGERTGLANLKDKLITGTQEADIGYAAYRDFWNKRKAGTETRTLAEFMKDLQTEYTRGNTRINLRKAVQEAQRAGLTGGGVRGDMESYAKGQGRNPYQLFMEEMRTGNIGPQPQALYRGEFPKTYGFMRGLDSIQDRGIYGALANKMFGDKTKDMLPYDSRLAWFDKLRGEDSLNRGEAPGVDMWRYFDPEGKTMSSKDYYDIDYDERQEKGYNYTYDPRDPFATDDELRYGNYLQNLQRLFPRKFIPTDEDGILAFGKKGKYSAFRDYETDPETLATMRLINERIRKGADPTTGGARLSLSDFSKDNTQQITYGSREDGSDGDGSDGDGSDGDGSDGGNQFAFADPGKIGYFDPETGTYKYGTYGDYAPFAEVKDGGIIELGHGGYLNDYTAADSLMFKDPQEEEEWEYNV